MDIKKLGLILLLVLICGSVKAQRKMDTLGRGLVAMKAKSGNFMSWRRLGEEYYDVTYNVYRNGTKIASNLSVTNFSDGSGGTSDRYTVSAVVRGIEQSQCAAVAPWKSYCPSSGYGNQNYYSGYLDITLQPVYSYSGKDVTSTYIPNDSEVADLDGDGEMEIIVKRISTEDDAAQFVTMSDPHYNIFDAYKLDGTRLWWIDAGPNMVSGSSTEFNLIAYDWDQDGKAEVLLRGADGMVIHYKEQNVWKTQTIGNGSVNTRNTVTHTANMTYTNTGDEFLIYMNGLSGKPYKVITYPLARESASAWGDNYGHRSSKYFMGAPYLDGRKPFIFLGRGIYTRHKMCALKVDPSTHDLTKEWSWECNNSSSPWYGNGYHNYIIADVDEDGRDEIVYGSMVIDDNGKGLSTTGYGHGDAQHVSDFDPYRKGLEFVGCLEEGPYHGFNYRDATTSKVYFKHTGTGDDGRAIAGNFSNSYPGAFASSAGHTTMISCVADKESSELPQVADYMLNFRLYWDGDLLSETMSSKSHDGWAMIEAPNKGRIFTSDGNVHLNSYTKNVPSFQGDILGDWREEIILTNGTNLRIYTSGFPSEYSLPTLWHDHQYRQAMVWQMHAYNQPPHLSYYLGQMEGYTQAPPPQLTNGRTEIGNGGTISSSYNNKQVIACETGNMTINVEDGASPWVFTDNAPSWVQGNDVNGTSGQKVKTDGAIGATSLPAIDRVYYTHTVNGGAFTGGMHLSKQGDGKLILPNVTETYTGSTKVWAGTLQFNGTMQSSPVWMNRHTTLDSDGGQFLGGLTMEYGSTLNIGGETKGNISTVTVSSLTLNYGSRVVFDINGLNDNERDRLNATSLIIDDGKVGQNVWENFGPQYIVPVFELNVGSILGNGRYCLGEVGNVTGDLSKIQLECQTMDRNNISLVYEGGKLYLEVTGVSTVGEASFEIVDMVNYQNIKSLYPWADPNDFYLPVVGVKPVEQYGQTAKVSATFTSLDGTVKDLGSSEATTLYSQNYENESAVTGWTTSGAPMSIASDDSGHGKYFLINMGNTNTRYAYTRIDGLDFSVSDQYTIEFDMAMKAGNTDGSEFCVMSKGGKSPTNNWDNYAYINENKNMLFDLSAPKSSTTCTVNGTTTTTTLASDTWYHVKLLVNQATRKVNWSISNGSSGTYELPAGTSTEFNGFHLVAGRYYSVLKLDNIVITQGAVDLSNYAFTEPGTLTVTSTLSGMAVAPSVVSFEVKKPYKVKCETPDYSTIAGADAASVLGESFGEPFVARWAFWNKSNSRYGQEYVMVSSGKEGGYLDKAALLNFHRTNNAVFHLVESYGIGHNYIDGNTTITAENLGDQQTIVYHKANLSRGYDNSMDEGYGFANADGTWSYELYQNCTFCKFKAFVPFRGLVGDLNHDGNVDITDIVLLVNYILGDANAVVDEYEADINSDGSIDVTDVVLLVNIQLNN